MFLVWGHLGKKIANEHGTQIEYSHSFCRSVNNLRHFSMLEKRTIIISSKVWMHDIANPTNTASATFCQTATNTDWLIHIKTLKANRHFIRNNRFHKDFSLNVLQVACIHVPYLKISCIFFRKILPHNHKYLISIKKLSIKNKKSKEQVCNWPFSKRNYHSTFLKFYIITRLTPFKKFLPLNSLSKKE